MRLFIQRISMPRRVVSTMFFVGLGFSVAGAALADPPIVPPPGAQAPAVPAPTEAAPAPNLEIPVQLPDSETKLQVNGDFGSAAPGSVIGQSNIELLDIDTLRSIYEPKDEKDLFKLSLADCIALALKQNNDILIAEIEPQVSATEVYTAKGEFDPGWKTTAQYLNAAQSVNQQLARFGGITSIRQYQTTIDSTIGGKLHTGTQYAMVFDLSKEENTYGKFIEDFSTTLSFQLTQPLLRGLGRGYNTFRIKAARNMQESNEWQLRLTVMNTVAQVTKAYWDVVGAVEAIKVAEGSLSNAKRLLTINETRRQIGTAADLEVLQAKAGVSSRQNDLVNATARAVDAGDILKQYLDLRDGDFLSKARIVPLDRPGSEDVTLATADDFNKSLDDAVAIAVEKRPEIRIAALTIDNAELDAEHSRKDLRPQLDLTGSISQGGRNHYLSEALTGIPNRSDTAFTYGFQATIPLGNRSARGAYERSELRAEQAGRQLQKARTAIMTNVHLAVRNMETNRILVKNSRQAVAMQEANVNAEEERLRLGVTTSWQVLQVQEALTAVQTQELQSRIAYEKARIDLQTAKGTLMEDLGVDYDMPEAEKPIGFFEALKKGVKE